MTTAATTADVRRDNLRRLIEALGGATALALKLKYANGTYLSQIAGPNPTRALGEKAARHIEATLGLPTNWMDTPDAPMTFSKLSVKAKSPITGFARIWDGQIAQAKAAAAGAVSQADDIDINTTAFHYLELPEPGPRDLPVFGQAQGGFDGVEVDYQNPVEYLPRPPILKNSPKACGVYVTGESMEPRYFAGEIVLVDPRKPVRSGDFVVVELHDNKAIVKRLLRRNDNGATLGQLNPKLEESMPREKIVGIYRIVGSYSE